MKKFLLGGKGAGDSLGDFGLLLLRVFGGLALAFGHGMGKLPPKEGFVNALAGMNLPVPQLMAWCAALSEFGGGLLLALGLLTRPSALTIAITMSVAAFIRHANDPFDVKEMALLFLAIAVFFMFAGGGRYSVDQYLRKATGVK